MIVADSSVWIDYLNDVESRETTLLDALLTQEPILMGDLIYVEVLQGFRKDSDARRAGAALDILPFASMGGRDISIASIRNYRKLRAKGLTPRKTIDVIIGAFCIERGHELLHCDRDFDPMEEHLGLRVA